MTNEGDSISLSLFSRSPQHVIFASVMHDMCIVHAKGCVSLHDWGIHKIAIRTVVGINAFDANEICKIPISSLFFSLSFYLFLVYFLAFFLVLFSLPLLSS